jgi:magnesium-transporting ATPase (P-type)
MSATGTDWHALTPEEAVRASQTDPRDGLTAQEVEQRLAEFGPNEVPGAPGRSAWARLGAQFTNPLIVVLLASSGVTALLSYYIDAAVILGVVLINAAIGFLQEGRAEDALAAVRQMLPVRATVVRAGERHDVPAAALVPGDIVLLASGDRVPADLRLLSVRNLNVDEAALTGESVPVLKDHAALREEAAMADRDCMAHSGTVVVRGTGRGVTVATGERTQLGRIGSLVRTTGSLSTPLTRRLDRFARQITAVILVIGALAFLATVGLDRLPAGEAFLAVVGLAVAAVPEGLPAVITIILAIASRSMAAHRAIVRRLPAVETLGSVSVICSDKTGTLTRNEITAVALMTTEADFEVTGVGYSPEGGIRDADGRPVEAAEDPQIMRLVESAALCNDASLLHKQSWVISGDPTEGALATLAVKAGLDLSEVRAENPRRDEIPFESENRYMATLHHDHRGDAFVIVKGAPERVWHMCSHEDEQWLDRAEAAARNGQRVLAVARAPAPGSVTALNTRDLPDGFRILGLIGMIDPPRQKTVGAIADCQRAGIDIKMITGDHLSTAEAVARSIGLRVGRGGLEGHHMARLDDDDVRRTLADTDVIARASPEDKIRLVRLLQSTGAFVAMTGDGANDAPALKAADIGVAMGGRGTDAARDASEIVLTDDDFSTIRDAVQEGRVVYDNVKKSLQFLLPTSGGEALLILTALLAGTTLPVTVTQILWVNMVTAVTLALALAFEPAEPEVMWQPPRPSEESLMTRPLVIRIAFVSVLMVLAALVAFQWELSRGSSLEDARTAAVTVLVFCELVYLFNVRHFTRSAFNAETLTGNRVAILVAAVLIVLQLAFIYFPPMQALFHSAPLSAASWVVILCLALAVFLAVEAEKALLRRRGVRRF